jgi:hypothetical protein
MSKIKKLLFILIPLLISLLANVFAQFYFYDSNKNSVLNYNSQITDRRIALNKAIPEKDGVLYIPNGQLFLILAEGKARFTAKEEKGAELIRDQVAIYIDQDEAVVVGGNIPAGNYDFAEDSIKQNFRSYTRTDIEKLENAFGNDESGLKRLALLGLIAVGFTWTILRIRNRYKDDPRSVVLLNVTAILCFIITSTIVSLLAPYSILSFPMFPLGIWLVYIVVYISINLQKLRNRTAEQLFP